MYFITSLKKMSRLFFKTKFHKKIQPNFIFLFYWRTICMRMHKQHVPDPDPSV